MPVEIAEPVVSVERPGWHRVRALARGRRIDYDLSASDSVEEYCIVVWPESTARERISRDGDHLFT